MSFYPHWSSDFKFQSSDQFSCPLSSDEVQWRPLASIMDIKDWWERKWRQKSRLMNNKEKKKFVLPPTTLKIACQIAGIKQTQTVYVQQNIYFSALIRGCFFPLLCFKDTDNNLLFLDKESPDYPIKNKGKIWWIKKIKKILLKPLTP